MNFLITGVSGSGKTTIAAELVKQGYDARNMDSIQGLYSWVNLASGNSEPDNREKDPDWLETHDWFWDKDKLTEFLSGSDNTFFCGSSGNQTQFYSLFDRVILLEMDVELIKERVLNNNHDHSYGRMPGEIEAILGYFEGFQDEAKEAGAIVIEARIPLNKITSLVIAETEK